MMKRLDEINRDIERLKADYESVQGTTTEVYSRIVGYYRSVKNWNMGKREEYGRRVQFRKLTLKRTDDARTADTFTVQSARIDGELSAYYFFRKQCPNCPPVSALLAEREYRYSGIDVDTAEGMDMASKYTVYSTPTVLVLNGAGEEVFRSSNPRAIGSFLEENAVKPAYAS